MQKTQACDHRRKDVFKYAFCTHSASNDITWSLKVLQTEIIVQTLYMTEERTPLAANRSVAISKLPTELVLLFKLH